MGSSLKALTMGAGIFMTCVLISMSLLILREGKQLGNQFIKELKEEERFLGENKWTRYDGAFVSGAEVINAVRRFQKEISVVVNNQINEETYTEHRLFHLSENIDSSPSYIEPFDDYVGSVIRKKNGEVKAIRFKKKG